MKKLFALFSIALVAMFAVSCDSEDPVVDDSQNTVQEDPFKDYPKVGSIEIAFGEEDTRIAYDGLVEEGNTRKFKSSFNYATEDVVIIIAYNPSTGQIGQYPYKPNSGTGKWEPVTAGGDAPYQAGVFKYTAYWFGSNDGTQTFGGVPTSADAWKNKTIEELEHYILQEWINTTTVSTDQGTLAKFKAADFIMPYNVTDDGNNKVSFNLEHKMGLAVIHAAEADVVYSIKTLSCDPYYKWFEKTTYDQIVLDAEAGDIGGCIPYRDMDGDGADDEWFYLWVTPKEFGGYTIISADNAWSRTLQISSGKFQRLNFTKTINETFVLQLGDIYYDDGSLTHNGVVNTTATVAGTRKPLGIVVSLEGGLANPEHANIIDNEALTAIETLQRNYVKQEVVDLNGNVIGIENRGKKDDGTAMGYHALVMALNDAITVNESYYPNPPATSTTQNGGCAWRSTQRQVYNFASYPTTIGQLKTDYSGYKNSHVVYNLSEFRRTTFPAFYYVKNYSDKPKSTTPATDWFIASAGQWCSLGNQIFGKEPGNTTMWRDNGELGPSTFDESNVITESTTITDGTYAVYGFFSGQSTLNTLLERAGGSKFTTYTYWSSTQVRVLSGSSYTYNPMTFCLGSHNELALGFDHPMPGKSSYYANLNHPATIFNEQGESLGTVTGPVANWETVRGMLCF